MTVWVPDRNTAARILRHWRMIGLTIEILARGVAWRGWWRYDTHILTLIMEDQKEVDRTGHTTNIAQS